VWDLRDGRCVRTVDTKSIVNSIALSSDGALFAVGNQDAGVRLYDVRNGAKVEEATELHAAAVTGVQFSRADGGARLLSTSRDNTLRVSSGRTLEPLAALSLASVLAAVGDGGGGSGTGGGGGSDGIVNRLDALSRGDYGPSIAAASGPAVGAAGSMQTLAAATTSGGGSNGAQARPAVLKHPNFRVPVNWSRGVWSPNGMYAACGSASG
jgi:WD40 repeat protein